ncbi:MAG: Na+/H+ antiporter subunit E [Firmicutes bacterium]|nr:Na+/H+ antiporter subunit E [Bacillota bacterium]
MVKYWVKGTAILYILWLLLSGILKPKFLIVGFVTSLIITFICLPSLWIEGRDGKTKYCLLDVSFFKLAKYWIWLFIEIAKSSISVAKIVVSPKMKMNPQLIEFDCWYKNPIATSVLINSIILTPGTVTVEVTDERHFLVHALTDEAALGLMDGTMQRKIAELFGE